MQALAETLTKAGINLLAREDRGLYGATETADEDSGMVISRAYILRQAWPRAAQALHDAGIRYLYADYGNEVELTTVHLPPVAQQAVHERVATVERGEAEGQALRQAPRPPATPQVAATPGPRLSTAQAIAQQLRQWWRIHRTEPGCRAAAVRYIYGDNAPNAGSYYYYVAAAINLLEAEIAQEETQSPTQ